MCSESIVSYSYWIAVFVDSVWLQPLTHDRTFDNDSTVFIAAGAVCSKCCWWWYRAQWGIKHKVYVVGPFQRYSHCKGSMKEHIHVLMLLEQIPPYFLLKLRLFSSSAHYPKKSRSKRSCSFWSYEATCRECSLHLHWDLDWTACPQFYFLSLTRILLLLSPSDAWM